jgi:hypothetical protein
MLKPIMLVAAISLALTSLPAFAQQKSCEDVCRTKFCTSQGMASVNMCMSKCVQSCAMKRSNGKKAS